MKNILLFTKALKYKRKRFLFCIQIYTNLNNIFLHHLIKQKYCFLNFSQKRKLEEFDKVEAKKGKTFQEEPCSSKSIDEKEKESSKK